MLTMRSFCGLDEPRGRVREASDLARYRAQKCYQGKARLTFGFDWVDAEGGGACSTESRAPSMASRSPRARS